MHDCKIRERILVCREVGERAPCRMSTVMKTVEVFRWPCYILEAMTFAMATIFSMGSRAFV